MNKEKCEFGITESIAKEILEIALSTGGEFAEVFMETTTNEAYEMTSGKVSKINVSKVKGAAIRVDKGFIEVNASITECTVEALINAAKTLAQSFTGEKVTEVLPFEVKIVEKVVDPKVYTTNNDEEIRLLSEASTAAKEYSPEIVQVIAHLTKKLQNIFKILVHLIAF